MPNQTAKDKRWTLARAVEGNLLKGVLMPVAAKAPRRTTDRTTGLLWIRGLVHPVALSSSSVIVADNFCLRKRGERIAPPEIVETVYLRSRWSSLNRKQLTELTIRLKKKVARTRIVNAVEKDCSAI